MLLEDLNSILRHRKALSIEQDQIVQKCVAPIVFYSRLDQFEEAAHQLAKGTNTVCASGGFQPPDFCTSSGTIRSLLATAGRPAEP